MTVCFLLLCFLCHRIIADFHDVLTGKFRSPIALIVLGTCMSRPHVDVMCGRSSCVETYFLSRPWIMFQLIKAADKKRKGSVHRQRFLLHWYCLTKAVGSVCACLGIFSLLPNNSLVFLFCLLGLDNAVVPRLVNWSDLSWLNRNSLVHWRDLLTFLHVKRLFFAELAFLKFLFRSRCNYTINHLSSKKTVKSEMMKHWPRPRQPVGSLGLRKFTSCCDLQGPSWRYFFHDDTP